MLFDFKSTDVVERDYDGGRAQNSITSSVHLGLIFLFPPQMNRYLLKGVIDQGFIHIFLLEVIRDRPVHIWNHQH